jgi:hypothetical protein
MTKFSYKYSTAQFKGPQKRVILLTYFRKFPMMSMPMPGVCVHIHAHAQVRVRVHTHVHVPFQADVKVRIYE